MIYFRELVKALIVGLSLAAVAYCAGHAVAQRNNKPHLEWWGP